MLLCKMISSKHDVFLKITMRNNLILSDLIDKMEDFLKDMDFSAYYYYYYLLSAGRPFYNSIQLQITNTLFLITTI